MCMLCYINMFCYKMLLCLCYVIQHLCFITYYVMLCNMLCYVINMLTCCSCYVIYHVMFISWYITCYVYVMLLYNIVCYITCCLCFLYNMICYVNVI